MARVLLAEDDPDLRDLMQLMLEHEGIDVVAVGDGASVLAASQDHRPDLLVLDLSLPGVTGVEVVRSLRAERSLEHLPVLVVTGLSREHGVADALKAGATDYLTKPFRSTDLVQRVQLLLSQVAP